MLEVLPPSIHRDPCLSVEGFSSCQQADSFIQKEGAWSSFYIWKYVFHEVNETMFATGIFSLLDHVNILKLWFHHFAERERKSVWSLACGC